MKKLIFGLFLTMCILFSTIQAQGDLSTPYSIDGWDIPIEFTNHYQLPVYRLLSNPGGWINKSQAKVDSLLNALIVLTDTLQLQIRNDTLIHSNYMSGQSSFPISEVWDTVNVVGMDSSDVVVATVREGANNTAVSFVINIDNGRFRVGKASGAATILKYNWIWIRHYD